MTPKQAIAFIRKHGIVLESAEGPVPSLAQAIAGSNISGSWWSHPMGKDIFRVTRAVRASDQVLVCRLVAGKITFVHARLWPALVRAAEHFQPGDICQLVEEHTVSGRHQLKEVPFPSWVPTSVTVEADKLDALQALSILGAIIPGVGERPGSWSPKPACPRRGRGPRRGRREALPANPPFCLNTVFTT